MARKRSRKATRRSTVERAARRPIAIGRDLAAEVIRFRNGALKGRAAAVRRKPSRRAMLRSVPPALVQAVGGTDRSGVLVAEGDSWFDYPFYDVLQKLDDEFGWDIDRKSVV